MEVEVDFDHSSAKESCGGVESFGLDLGSYFLTQCKRLDTPVLKTKSYNDKEVCVWCQNFVGLNLTSFLPPNPRQKNLAHWIKGGEWEKLLTI